MRVSINQAERSLAQLAVELGDKECEAARKSLEQLHVDDMVVAALQGRIGEVRVALKDTKQHVYDWSFDQRRALSICLRIFRDKLRKLGASEAKLTVETSATDEKITDIGDFLARLAGQESFFREDGDDMDPPPPKLSPAQVEDVRLALERDTQRVQ
jgi:hypothetical protein